MYIVYVLMGLVSMKGLVDQLCASQEQTCSNSCIVSCVLLLEPAPCTVCMHVHVYTYMYVVVACIMVGIDDVIAERVNRETVIQYTS